MIEMSVRQNDILQPPPGRVQRFNNSASVAARVNDKRLMAHRIRKQVTVHGHRLRPLHKTPDLKFCQYLTSVPSCQRRKIACDCSSHARKNDVSILPISQIYNTDCIRVIILFQEIIPIFTYVTTFLSVVPKIHPAFLAKCECCIFPKKRAFFCQKSIYS